MPDLLLFFLLCQSYYFPRGFSMGGLADNSLNLEHLVDDPEATEPNNVAGRVNELVQVVELV